MAEPAGGRRHRRTPAGRAPVAHAVRAEHQQVRSRSNKQVELPLGSCWYPTAEVPGWACGHAQTNPTPSRDICESMAGAHAHSSTVMGDVLSSLPPLRRGVQLGWRACYGFTSVHRLPRPLGYTARAVPPIRHDTSRWVCSSSRRHEDVTPHAERSHTVVPEFIPKGCVHARVWQRVEWIRRGRSLHSHGSRLPTVSWLCIHLTVGRVGK